MRIILTVLLPLLIASCGGDGTSRISVTSAAKLTETDLSGTWVSRYTRETFSKDTGEYLYTRVGDSILVIRDDVLGTVVNNCLSHGLSADTYVVKTDRSLYWGGIYVPNPDGTLEYQGKMEDDPYDEGLQHTTNHKLIPISNDENLDFGTVAINGGFTFYEDARVCFRREAYSYLPYQNFTLDAPLDGGYIGIFIRIRDDLTPGVYAYNEARDANEVYLDTNCTSQACYDADFSPSPKDVVVTLTNVTPERVTGSFSFTDMYGSELDYTGEFDILLPQIP